LVNDCNKSPHVKTTLAKQLLGLRNWRLHRRLRGGRMRSTAALLLVAM